MNLSEHMLLWLGLVVVILTLIKQALHTDTFDRVLANLSIPPLKKMLVPWVMLVVGVGLGFAVALVAGLGWQAALAGSIATGMSALFVGATGGGGPAAAHPAPRVEDGDSK